MTREPQSSENWDLEERTRLEQQLLAKRRSRAAASSIGPQSSRAGQLALSSAQQRGRQGEQGGHDIVRPGEGDRNGREEQGDR